MVNNRTGEISYNNNGSKMKIIKYTDANNIIVVFDNNYSIRTSYKQFKLGNIRNPYDKTVYKTGYIGEGKYKVINNKKINSQYDVWKSMLQRCYSEEYISKHPTYKDCYVDTEWHNYQNFAKWYDENYYEVKGQRMELDKDILNKHNKTYSQEKCVFVPQCINTLFTKRQQKRGGTFIGVSYKPINKKYQASCNDGTGKSIYLGLYNTMEEAFNVYKNYKENLIKQIANDYKDKIPSKLYGALIKYIVNIND